MFTARYLLRTHKSQARPSRNRIINTDKTRHKAATFSYLTTTSPHMSPVLRTQYSCSLSVWGTILYDCLNSSVSHCREDDIRLESPLPVDCFILVRPIGDSARKRHVEIKTPGTRCTITESLAGMHKNRHSTRMSSRNATGSTFPGSQVGASEVATIST